MTSTLHLDSLINPGDPAIRVMKSFHTTGTRHSHDFYELVYVTEGYCLHRVENLSTLIMEGDIFILRPGITHAYSGNRVTRIYNCIFDCSVLGDDLTALRRLPGQEDLFGSSDSATVQLHLSLSERKNVSRHLSDMLELMTARPMGWEILLKTQLVSLMVEYSRAYAVREEDLSSDTAYPAYVRKTLEVIDERYMDPELSIHAIAEHVGVSDDYLTRQFKLITGIATQQYLRRYRFARAMELLQTGMSVSDVARNVGFNALSYFSREFTKELGIPPSRYRDQMENP